MNVEGREEHGNRSNGRNNGEVNPENGGGPRDNQHGGGPCRPKKKLREVVASLDDKVQLSSTGGPLERER